jgi:diaminopimelate epimerase
MTIESLSFLKVHGLGNDFVLLDGIAYHYSELDFEAFAIAACDRHRGIGADGLLLLAPSKTAAVRMRMWNPDGTEDMCGNGLRCIARVAHLRGYAGHEFFVETVAGLRSARIEADGNVRVSMGEPCWEAADIPMTAPDGISPREYHLEADGESYLASSLSTGSTHTVIWRDELPSDEEFFRVSPRIENHPRFPDRTTVLWAAVAGGGVSLRIWERGVGETLACGTGACAAAVAALDTGRVNHGPVQVQSKGGVLKIEWIDDGIWKTGPAEIVYEGRWR